VDRLRRHNHLLRQEARALLQRIRQVGTEAGPAGSPPLQEVTQAAEQLAGVLRDLQEVPGYHPTHDQVTVIAVRPLVEQVFRWQQRLLGAPGVGLALRRFKKLLERSGVQKELRRRKYYEKPCEARRRAKLRKLSAIRKGKSLSRKPTSR
jgi:small subunit ribosomal protein S21